MGSTRIEYCTKTWNPIEGCAPCSPGCDRCWARKWAQRAECNQSFIEWHDNEPAGCVAINPYAAIAPWDGTLAEFPHRWDEPVHWRQPQRVFVGSRSDIALWPENAVIRVRNVMTECANRGREHRFLWLTKRPSILAGKLSGMPMPGNCWLGGTVCNQGEADEKIPRLLAIPAAGHWVSVEPMLGPVHVLPWLTPVRRPYLYGDDSQRGIGLLVCGGESGKGARPLNPDWVRALRDQCREARVSFYFKQWSDGQSNYPYHKAHLDGTQYRQLPAALRLPGEGE